MKKVLGVLLIILTCVTIFSCNKGDENMAYCEIYTRNGTALNNDYNVENVDYTLTRKIYDKDTINISGTLKKAILNPFLFVLKDESDKYIYSAYINNWKYNSEKNTVEFSGLDYKSIFDNDVYFKYSSTTLDNTFQTVVTTCLDAYNDTLPTINLLSFTVSFTDTTDTTEIANLYGQEFNTNANKFLKPYFNKYKYFLDIKFNESTLALDVSVKNNLNTAEINLDDFDFTSTQSQPKINQALVTVNQASENNTDSGLIWKPTTKNYYDNASVKYTLPGFQGFANYESCFVDGSRGYPSSSFDYLYAQTSTNFATFVNNNNRQFYIYLPKTVGYDYPETFFTASFGNLYGVYGRIPVLSRDFKLQIKQNVYLDSAGTSKLGSIEPLENVKYKDFGDGWYFIDASNFTTFNFLALSIVFKESQIGTPQAVLDKFLDKIIACNEAQYNVMASYSFQPQTQIDGVGSFLYPLSFPPNPKPNDICRTQNNLTSLYKYWQLTTMPQNYNKPKIKYYLGLDNEIYENVIPAEQKRYPEVSQTFTADNITEAQLDALYNLASERYITTIIINDSDKLNPVIINNLGLYSFVKCYNINGDNLTLPISEITYKNGKEVSVKLGFKKLKLTDIIRGD